MKKKKNKKNKQKIDLFDFNPITFPKIREAYGWQYSASDCADIENGKTTKISKKMKLTLDFETKTVHIDEPCNLKEFFDFMMKQGGLQEWTVEGSERVVYYPANPVSPWYSPQYDEHPFMTDGTREFNPDQHTITTTDGAFKRENIDPGNPVGMEGRCITDEQIKDHEEWKRLRPQTVAEFVDKLYKSGKTTPDLNKLFEQQEDNDGGNDNKYSGSII